MTQLAGSAGGQRRERILDGGEVRALRGKGCLERGDVRALRGNVRRHAEKHVEAEPERADENRDDPGANAGHPAQPDTQFRKVRPQFRKVGFRRDAAGDGPVNRIAQRLGLRLGKAGTRQVFHDGVGIERHIHFQNIGPGTGPGNRDSLPAPRRALLVLIALFLVLCFAPGAHAQSRPIGTAPNAAPDLRATLGDCPAELLRRAWNEMLPLEAAAVEREVLALCTERSEAMAGFLAAQERLDGALAAVRASAASSSATAASTADGPDDARMGRLRGEIAGLRARIARLEGEPERPETGATLAGLRDDLVTAEADLARMEGGVAASGDPGALPSAAPGPGTAEGPALLATETVRIPGTGPPASVSPDTQADPGSLSPDDGIASLPPPGAKPDTGVPADGSVAVPPPGTAQAAPDPREGPTEWQVVFAVRKADGPWRIRLQGRREIAFPVPVAASADGDANGAAVIPTDVRWRTVTESDPPVDLSVGEALPDGLELLAVTPEGVEIGDPGDPNTAPVLVPFATAGDSDPGALAWDFRILGGEEEQ